MLQYTPLIYFTSRRESKSGAAKIVNMGEGPACSSTKPPLTCKCKSCVDHTQLALTFLARRRTYKTAFTLRRHTGCMQPACRDRHAGCMSIDIFCGRRRRSFHARLINVVVDAP